MWCRQSVAGSESVGSRGNSSALTQRRGLCSGKQCHFPSAFLQFHKSLHLEKTPHGNEREKVPWNSRQLSSPRLENALGNGENVFDDSDSTLYTYRSSKNREIVHLAPRLPEFLLGSDFKNKLIKWLGISSVLFKDSHVAAHDHKEDQKSDPKLRQFLSCLLREHSGNISRSLL